MTWKFKANLPLHNSRKVAFPDNMMDDRPFWTRLQDGIKRIINIAIHAPTGSPSDGLGADGTESTTSTSVFINNQKQLLAEKDGEDWKVDEIVVAGGDVDLWRRIGTERETTTGGSTRSDTGSVHNMRGSPTAGTIGSGVMSYNPSLRKGAKKIWDAAKYFFDTSFDNENSESEFKKLQWYSMKSFAFYGSIFLVVNWVLYLILNKRSTEKSLYAELVYYGGLTLLTIPLPFLVAADVPLKWPLTFQIWFCLAVWWCGLTEIIQMNICQFFKQGKRNCGSKDFLAMMFYITGVPALMLFSIPHRLFSAIMMLVTTILISVLLIPDQGIFARNLVSFIIFSVFLQALHFNKEVSERRLFLLNSQLKVAYRAQQKAQMAQSRAGDAKRRFATYIFHEVRVPLNNAAIAFDNLIKCQVFTDRKTDPYGEDVDALEVSLDTVQQVLNDALDFEKMDSGRFEIKRRNFQLNNVIRSTLAPLSVTAAAKQLELKVELDPKIDECAPRMHAATRKASPDRRPNDSRHQYPPFPSPGYSHSQPGSPSDRPFEATDYISGGAAYAQVSVSNTTSHSPRQRDSIKSRRAKQRKVTFSSTPGPKPDDNELWVVGDEVRLRQILTNLVSNAIKFTPSGAGDIQVRTSLVTCLEVEDSRPMDGRRSSIGSRHSQENDALPTQDVLVLRMEIIDSGPGIKPSDFSDGQLFQPFGQTRVGKMSHNSTGLGLAIVRQIVLNSGGRLGVKSEKGQGATFWVELSYPIARVRPSETGPASAFDNGSSFAFVAANSPSIQLSLPPPSLVLTPVSERSENNASDTTSPTIAVTTPPLTSDTFTPLSLDHSDGKNSASDTTGKAGVVTTPPGLTPPLTTSDIAPMLASQIPLVLDGSNKAPSGNVYTGLHPTLSSVIPPLPPTISNSTEITSKPGPSCPPLSSFPREPNDKILVLVVDDEVVTRKTLKRALELRGCEVHTANDGQACVDLLLSPQAPDYDLVTLDNRMPIMTGEVAVKKIRTAGLTELFIVGLTGNALTDDQRSYILAGVDRILTKPIDTKGRTLDELLETARQRRLARETEGTSDIEELS